MLPLKNSQAYQIAFLFKIKKKIVYTKMNKYNSFNKKRPENIYINCHDDANVG
jgi:hypothetical protein